MYKLKLGNFICLFRDGKKDETYLSRLDEMKKQGFDSVDFDMTFLYTQEEISLAYDDIRKGLKEIRERGFYLNGIHLPFGHHRDYSFLEEERREKLCEDTIELFKIIDDFNPYCYILHGTKEPMTSEERKLHAKALKKSLVALRTGTKAEICLENLPRSCYPNTADETIETVDSVKGISVCCDINHFLLEKAEDAVLKLGNRIKTLHVSDCDYVDERHTMPGLGRIDWMKVIGALEKIGYKGVFNYEVIMERPGWKFFNYSDIKNNYEQLFEKYNKIKTEKQY